VRRREADVVLRPVDSGEENLIGRKIGRLGTGFYASRDYAARRRPPQRRDESHGHRVIGFADRLSNERLARWSDLITRQGQVVMRCSSQGDMLAAARAGLGISTLSGFVAAAYSDLVRVAPQKLVSVADIWLLAHPDLVELPAVRAVIDFDTACAREDRVTLRG
jgi:DNA-binding transcriptional LysR family regulator